MKVKNISVILFRHAIFLILVCGLLLFDQSPGRCESYNLKPETENAKPVLNGKDNSQKLNNIPYPNITDNIPLVSDAKISNINETIAGLIEAGYSLDEIVGVLKNDDYKAPKISIACLKAGYNGTKIFKALLKAGFSQRTAEAAVPAALRTSSQPFASNDNNPDSVEAEITLIEPNPFTKGVQNEPAQETKIQKEKKAQALNIDPLEVPISVGVTFNGLGNWSDFQDKRFNNTLR